MVDTKHYYRINFSAKELEVIKKAINESSDKLSKDVKDPIMNPFSARKTLGNENIKMGRKKMEEQNREEVFKEIKKRVEIGEKLTVRKLTDEIDFSHATVSKYLKEARDIGLC